MPESIQLIAVLALATTLVIVGVPRLIGYWFTHTSWTLSAADLTQRFHGLMLFGKEGSYLALNPKGEPGRISFTKTTVEEGNTTFELRVESPRATPELIETIAAQLDAQPTRIRWSLVDKNDPSKIQIDITGPAACDPATMEGLAKRVVAALGYDSTQKYRVDFEGPTDDDKIADFLTPPE